MVDPVTKMIIARRTTFLLLLIASCAISVFSIQCKIHDVYPVDEIVSATRSCVGRMEGSEYSREAHTHNGDDRNDPYRIRNRGPLQMKFERSRRSSNDHGNNPGSDGYHRRVPGEQNGRECMWQCVYEQLNMVDKDGFPDKHKVMYVLSQNIREQELVQFQKDGIDECFHHLQVEKMKTDKCQYTLAFSNCLTNYHDSNCEDWEKARSGLRHF